MRVNTTLQGPLGNFARDLLQRGLARNIPDLLDQALRALEDRIIERELARARLDAVRTANSSEE